MPATAGKCIRMKVDQDQDPRHHRMIHLRLSQPQQPPNRQLMTILQITKMLYKS